MRLRGPDSEGKMTEPWADGVAGLGVRRLAIVDLETGDQPVTNEDASIVAILNGEIYNFIELRRELTAAGHRFTTSGDTEVLAHGYEEWGDSLLDHLDGMFALAIWDTKAHRLLLARDRLGKKPLFWTNAAGGIRFASELKALMSDGRVSASPDLGSLWTLLALQYVPPGRSPVADVNQLPPGHALVFEADAGGGRGSTRTWQWWDLWSVARSPLAMAKPGELLERLGVAVKRRLRADVPLGVFLSGGIDSSLVASTMASITGDVRTFSVGFEDADYSELPLARRVAETCGTDHLEIEVSWRDASIIPELVFRLDEPLADSSALPTYLVSQAAARELKVVLSGDGGDELFGGYDRYAMFLKWDRLWRAVRAARGESIAARIGSASSGARTGSTSISGRVREAARRAGVVMRRAAEPMPDRYLNFLGAFPAAERMRIAGPAFDALGSDRDLPISALLGARWPLRHDQPIASLGALDAETEMAGDILVKVDRMSMANSLEVRSPFLDHEFVEWALRLPDEARLRHGETKPLLRDAARMVLPSAIAAAPKRGFGIPLSVWLRTGLRPTVEEVLRDRQTRERGLTNSAEVETLLAEHLAGRAHGARIWMLFVVELWCRSYLDKPVPSPVSI